MESKPIDTTAFTALSLEQLREGQQRYARRFERSVETKPVSAVLKSIPMVAHAKPATPPELTLTDSVMKQRSLDLILNYRVDNAHIDARRLLQRILVEIEDKKTAAQLGVPFRFKWTEAQAAVITDLLKHAVNDPTSSIPLNKGWYLWGDMRKGKTLLATALVALHEAIPLITRKASPKEFTLSDVRQMYAGFLTLERRPTVDIYRFGDRCFDDVGTQIELDGIKSFGNFYDPMAEILWARHERWTRYGHITYMTSNLPFQAVTLAGGQVIPGYIDRFDERLQARLLEMMHPVLLPS